MYSQFLCIHVCTGSRLSSAVLSRGVKASKPAQESNMAMVFPFFPIQPLFWEDVPLKSVSSPRLQSWRTISNSGCSGEKPPEGMEDRPGKVYHLGCLGGSHHHLVDLNILYYIIVLYYILFYYRRKFRSQTSDNMDR